MAAETSPQHLGQSAQERSGRRRPFSSFMRKLASFKGSSSNDTNQSSNAKRGPHTKNSSKKPAASKQNNPYPESGRINGQSSYANGDRPHSPVPTGNTLSTSSLSRRRPSFQSSADGHPAPTIGNKSMAATINTDIAHSDAAASHAPSSGQGTTATVGGGPNGRGADSTFSSPAPSIRSLTTTLTTIHSAGPGTAAGPNNQANNNTQAIHFSHQFPSSPHPSAIPPHLVPHSSGGHPSTYNTATANNLLTDNASILTLASSSKRRRRRSMDTDASVRALAPSSLWGGSRESLPLSVLSANIETSAAPSSSHQPRPSGGPLNERASIYSTAGIAPALPSERNSYYAGKPSNTADAGSVKSGFLGHGRTDSISGSIGGIGTTGSPLASPREVGSNTAGVLSRTDSNWTANNDIERDVDTETETDRKSTKDAKENGKALK